MINYLMAAFLATSVTFAQTAQKPATKGSRPGAAVTTSTGSAKPASTTAPLRPLPEHSLQTKLQSNDNSNPNYKKEKARGRGVKREYTPRRTASGARKDTMNQRRPGKEETDSRR